jgi:hypothetical protein
MTTRPTLNEATEQLNTALLAVRDFAEGYVEQYGTTRRELLKIIHSNRAQWSGGPYNTVNIIETIIREKAIDGLYGHLDFKEKG